MVLAFFFNYLTIYLPHSSFFVFFFFPMNTLFFVVAAILCKDTGWQTCLHNKMCHFRLKVRRQFFSEQLETPQGRSVTPYGCNVKYLFRKQDIL